MTERTVTVKICTQLPVPVRNLEALERMAYACAKPLGVARNTITMDQEGNDLVITFDLQIEEPE